MSTKHCMSIPKDRRTPLREKAQPRYPGKWFYLKGGEGEGGLGEKQKNKGKGFSFKFLVFLNNFLDFREGLTNLFPPFTNPVGELGVELSCVL